jgi:hypothetical protein
MAINTALGGINQEVTMDTDDKTQGQASATQPTGTDPAGRTDPAQTGTAVGAEKAIPQSQVDALMARTRQEARERALRELGVSDMAEAKARLDAAKALEDANKTEAQRLNDNLAALEKERAEWADREARLQAEKASVLLRTAVIGKAAALGFADPEDAYRMLDLSNLNVGDDGGVAGLDQALKALGDSKPYLLRAAPRIAPTSPGAKQQTGESDEQRRARLYGGGATPIGSGPGGGLHWPGKL